MDTRLSLTLVDAHDHPMCSEPWCRDTAVQSAHILHQDQRAATPTGVMVKVGCVSVGSAPHLAGSAAGPTTPPIGPRSTSPCAPYRRHRRTHASKECEALKKKKKKN